VEAAMNESVTRQLEAQLSELRAQLEELDLLKDIQALERIIRRMKTEGMRSSASISADKSVGLGRQEAASSVTMKDAAERFLRGKTAPLQTKDVLDALNSEGIHVPGDNPQNNLSAHMSRDPRFLSLGRDGWVLAASVSPNEQRAGLAGEAYAAILEADSVKAVVSSLELSNDIPADQDRALLSYARSDFGRNLLEAEKRALRNSFKEAVQMRDLIGE
jgi:hypothetical protein